MTDSRISAVAPSHRASVATNAARLLHQEEEVEDDGQQGDEMEMEELPGAFAVGSGNVRPRNRLSQQPENPESGFLQVQSPDSSWMDIISSPGSLHSRGIQSSQDTALVTAPTVPILETVPSGPPPETAEVVLVSPSADPQDEKANRKGDRRIILSVIFVLLCMIVGAVVGILVGKKTETLPTSAPVPAPTLVTAAPTSPQRQQAFIDLMIDTISDPLALSTDGSPQRQAIEWLSDIDPAKLDPNDSTQVGNIHNRYVATVLYYSLGMDKVTMPTSWLSEANICKWNDGKKKAQNGQGIYCSGGNNAVTNITLTQQRLDGSIPTELSFFSTLKSLELSQNSITGSIPTELARLTSLIVLDLSK
jgi:hypothetical protein